MLALFNEKHADAEVIQSLLKHIKKIEGDIRMSKIIKSVDGKYYMGEFEEVDASLVTQIIAEKQAQLAALELIAPANDTPPAAPVAEPSPTLQPSVPTEPVLQPSDPAPVDPNTPVVPQDPNLQ